MNPENQRLRRICYGFAAWLLAKIYIGMLALPARGPYVARAWSRVGLWLNAARARAGHTYQTHGNGLDLTLRQAMR